MCPSLGRDSPSHSFTVQEGGKEPLLSVCRGGGRLWSPHPTATSQGRGGGEDQCQATQTQKKSLKAHRLEQFFFLFSFGLGDTPDLSGRKLRMGGALQIQLAITTRTL